MLQEKCKGSVQSEEAVPPGGWWQGLPVPGLPCTSCVSVPWSGTPHGKELRDTTTESWRLAPSHRPPISGAAPQLPVARVRFFNSCLCPSKRDLPRGSPKSPLDCVTSPSEGRPPQPCGKLGMCRWARSPVTRLFGRSLSLNRFLPHHPPYSAVNLSPLRGHLGFSRSDVLTEYL